MKSLRIDAPPTVMSPVPQTACEHTTDILIVGSGVTGLIAALRAARHARVTLLTREALLESNSAWAQGGIAAALDVADSPDLHINDTLIAGAGLSEHASAEALAWEAPMVIHELFDIGVPFERENDGFVLGLEGSHSRRRILHVGDATGLAITSTLVKQVRSNPNIRVLEGYQAIDLLLHEGNCAGILAMNQWGRFYHFSAKATILATGGAGALYGLTSNHPWAVGEGIALAYRAGAEVADMEFIQFHPTVMKTHDGQGFLISEATRGEGGQLLTPSGERFMPTYDSRAELAPRDIVTRGIYDAMRREGSHEVYLDLTHLSDDYLQRRFPTIYARCCSEGINPATQPIPVAPAAHYLMGGIRTDLYGTTTVAGLYAAGECACTGVHGANRLASNSLLECLVTGSRAALSAVQYQENRQPRKAQVAELSTPPITNGQHPSYPEDRPATMTQLTAIMRDSAGPMRSLEGLQKGLESLAIFPLHVQRIDMSSIRLANAALVAHLVIAGALVREESRGAHYRKDFPQSDESWKVHLVFGQKQVGYPVEYVTNIAIGKPLQATPLASQPLLQSCEADNIPNDVSPVAIEEPSRDVVCNVSTHAAI